MATSIPEFKLNRSLFGCKKASKMKKTSYSTILITGASSGLGKSLALNFAAPGVRLFLASRNREALEMTAKACREMGAEVDPTQLDVTQTLAVRAWVDSVAGTHDIDLAIANAGILGSHGPDRTFESAEIALKQIRTNLGGAINLVTSLAQHLQNQRHGHIALISSMSALQPIADMPAYAASKAGLLAYGEAISHFLHRDGIGVSVICPGFVKTPIADGFVSWRPFEISADAAAAKIRKALEQRRPFYAFPFELHWIIRLGRLVPWRLRRLTTRSFNYKR